MREMSSNVVGKIKIILNGMILFFSLLLGLLLVGNPIFTAYAQILPPTTSSTQSFLPPTSSGLLPPTQTTFPPSFLPPTQSFLPPSNPGIPTGSPSPWFPSLPAWACGGTFTFTVVGDFKVNNNNDNNKNNNNNNNNNNKDKSGDKKTIAVQIQASPAGSQLSQNSISGQIFKGKNNIEHNDGQDFTIRGVSNDCQVPMFTK